ncbi:MAG: hypothetical protein ACI9JN_001608 [Bacteroidia bacterium]|jgi:hypothetical protein
MYVNSFIAAIERTKRFELTQPILFMSPGSILNQDHMIKIAAAIETESVQTKNKDIAQGAFVFHDRFKREIEKIIGSPTYYTLGFVKVDDKELFKTSEDKLEQLLSDKIHFSEGVNMHAWLTLPTMEIIDLTLATTLGYQLNTPELLGLIVSGHADSQSIKYTPQIVGIEYLERIGALIALSA